MESLSAQARHRVFGLGAELVGPSGLELARKQGSNRLAVSALEALQHFPMGDGLPAALPHRHFFPRMGMAVDRLIDGAARSWRRAPDERHVATPQCAGAAVIGKLRRQ